MELEGPGCSDEDCTVFYHAPKARVLRNSVDQFALERTKVPMPDASPFACSRSGCDACYTYGRVLRTQEPGSQPQVVSQLLSGLTASLRFLSGGRPPALTASLRFLARGGRERDREYMQSNM